MNSMPYSGLIASSTWGSSRMCSTPATAIDRNQITMIGPNIAATFAVPRLCAANSTMRITTVSGATYSLNDGLASVSPSTADSTEIAGVITESPRNIDAPMTPTIKTNAVRRPSARLASAVSDNVPPSPLLSARNRISTYLNVTVTIKAHRMRDNTPNTVSRVTMPLTLVALAASRNAYNGLVPISP